MNVHSDEAPLIRRSLSIEQWHQLGLQGNMLPVTITLDGDSMRPLIRRRKDLVTILPLTRDVRIGDVVLFRSAQGLYVVHRVWKIRNGIVQTLGGSCVNPDSCIPVSDVWGLVVKVERDGKSIHMDGKAARVFGISWMAVYPLRRTYRQLRNNCGKVLRSLWG